MTRVKRRKEEKKRKSRTKYKGRENRKTAILRPDRPDRPATHYNLLTCCVVFVLHLPLLHLHLVKKIIILITQLIPIVLLFQSSPFHLLPLLFESS
ncbi:hypothetical protein F5H01DRAFT_328435 [Linnemannia elongata]|nr:hypothetical protein F5H01DRAFT_328435 [Linnemannia elongata]